MIKCLKYVNLSQIVQQSWLLHCQAVEQTNSVTLQFFWCARVAADSGPNYKPMLVGCSHEIGWMCSVKLLMEFMEDFIKYNDGYT